MPRTKPMWMPQFLQEQMRNQKTKWEINKSIIDNHKSHKFIRRQEPNCYFWIFFFLPEGLIHFYLEQFLAPSLGCDGTCLEKTLPSLVLSPPQQTLLSSPTKENLLSKFEAITIQLLWFWSWLFRLNTEGSRVSAMHGRGSFIVIWISVMIMMIISNPVIREM